MNRKRWWIVGIAVVVVACLGYVGVGALQQSSERQSLAQAAGEDTALVGRGTLRVTIDASGSVGADEEVALAFLSGGRVAEVLVSLGDEVQAGDVLARLDDDDARQAVQEAEIQMRQAEIDLATARMEAEVGLAEVDLQAAQAAYDEAAALAGRIGDQLASARVKLEQAQDTLNDAQADYDSAWDVARDWELDVPWKKDRLEADREATEDALAQAQYDLQVAQADYNLAVIGISEQEVQNAWSKVLNAQIAVESEPLRLEELELSLSQAKLALESAQRTLRETALVAPVAGTVSAVNVVANEMVTAGEPAVSLSDLSTLEVLVSVDETDVVHVALGQEVVVTVDALPDVKLTGEVVEIAPVADVQSGVVLYPMTIRLSQTELPVRAGMTADVEIVVTSKENALVVPLRAIQSEDDKSYVWRQSAGGFEQVEVTLGVMTETAVEIVAGLSEGDVVSVAASPAQGGGRVEQESGPMRLFGGGGDD